ncbi:hypothetical protein [Sphingomonas humi]|uniref:Uncharacterized protein n=1 Tax=Sphingomonas humi TaxID=335630 RepID=A0ABP7SF35_9SPHN
MSKVQQIQASFLDSLQAKHAEGKLVWKPREGEDSFETDLDDHTVHIDRKIIGTQPNYRVWIFPSKGEAFSFDTKNLTEVVPTSGSAETFTKLVGAIYRELKENVALEVIAKALDDLNKR